MPGKAVLQEKSVNDFKNSKRKLNDEELGLSEESGGTQKVHREPPAAKAQLRLRAEEGLQAAGRTLAGLPEARLPESRHDSSVE